MASTFELLAEQAEESLRHVDMERGSRGIGYALLAHAKAMENIAKALELHAKMQTRSSM